MKVAVILIVIGALGTFTKGLIKRLEELKIRTRGVSIQMTALLKIRQNTEKSLRESMRLAVTRNQVKDRQLILV